MKIKTLCQSLIVTSSLLLVACAGAPNQPGTTSLVNQSKSSNSSSSARQSAQTGIDANNSSNAAADQEALAMLEAAAIYEYMNQANAASEGSGQSSSSSGSSSSSEGDAWAGTCGPNADYNEQLVCSGVPASMLP